MPLPAATVAPARRVRGRLAVPGDKSIAHRYALLAALAEGRTTLTHFAPGADCRSTLACLRGLGVDVAERANGTVPLLGRGFGQLRSPVAPPDGGASRRGEAGAREAGVGRGAGGPAVCPHDGRRCLAVPPPDAPGDRTAGA